MPRQPSSSEEHLMATSEKAPSTNPTATPGTVPPANAKAEYASCEECGAPLDEKQRYCVSCGARRRDAGGPASRYFATAARGPDGVRAGPRRLPAPAPPR